MANICITLPKTIKWSDYERELEAVKDGSQEMNFKIPTIPKDVHPGDRCYICHDGFVKGWMTITSIGPKKGFDCTTTGQQWGDGNYVSRSGEFHYLKDPIPMKGFMGYRKFEEPKMNKTVYITEEQEQEIVNKYLKEALVVNSGQVSDIVNYLNNFYQAGVDYAGDVGVDGLPCQTLGINYVVNGQPLQKLKKEELLDVINDKFRRFIKDDASRLAYYSQIIDDWLNKRVKLTGQLSVNVISDDMVNKFKNYKKQPKQDNNKEDDKKEKKDSD